MPRSVLFKLVAVLFVLVSIVLILVILLQKGRGGGLTAAFGGGKKKTAKKKTSKKKAVKKAYFALSKEFHPDRYFKKNIAGYKDRLDTIFKKVLEAYEILMDPKLRAELAKIIVGQERVIEDTYYDTPDLRLARWGCTLRHRSGEGWTVKVPGPSKGVVLDRERRGLGGVEDLQLVRHQLDLAGRELRIDRLLRTRLHSPG